MNERTCNDERRKANALDTPPQFDLSDTHNEIDVDDDDHGSACLNK